MKLLRICSSVFLSIGLCALGYADEHFPFLAQVSKESVNVRAGANTNFEKIDKLTKGADVVVLGKSFDWYKIQLNSTARAYIRTDYLRMTQNSIAELLGDKVHVRAVANSDSTSLGMLKKGDLVRVIGQTNGWSQIEPPAQAAGWIRQDFLVLKSTNVNPSLIRGPLHPQISAKVPEKPLSIIEIKGRLMPLIEPKGDLHYEVIAGGKVVYYLKSVPDLQSFKGAMVVIKGFVISDASYDHPVLHVVNISLFL